MLKMDCATVASLLLMASATAICLDPNQLDLRGLGLTPMQILGVRKRVASASALPHTASDRRFTPKSSTAPEDPFAPLRTQLDAWPFTADFAVMVGNTSHGTVFNYTHGNFSLHSQVKTASASKWPIAMAFAGLVHDGTIGSLDDKVSRYVDWWSKDTVNDVRSNVTLRHLLTFTSGFGNGTDDATCMDDPHHPLGFVGCARHLYNTTGIYGYPGHTFAYSNIHLQLAGAVALAASGLPDIQHVVRKYLLQPYGLNETDCDAGAPNPQLAICLQTTAFDYSKFLLAQLGATVLPAAMVAESEQDYTTFCDGHCDLYGDYAFGHFLECFDSVAGFTDACKRARIHSDPGAYGFYPLIDRAKNYYMQIVAYEDGALYDLSGIPEYLRFLSKPLVDRVMEGAPYNDYLFAHHTPELNSLSLIDVNYIGNCFLHPATCASGVGAARAAMKNGGVQFS